MKTLAARPALALGAALWLASAPLCASGLVDPSDPVAGTSATQAPLEEGAPSLHEALLQGRWWLSLRLRYEDVDQDPFTREAHAGTLRTVLGYESAAWHGLSALLEFEDVSAFDERSYDSTINGVSDRPVIADPDGAEVNQAFLRYAGLEQLTAKLGRQRITLGNLRFIGNVGWRQNEQTYDALALESAELAGWTCFYAYLDNVNRVLGDASPVGDAPMSSHLLHVERPLEGWGKLSLYDYYLDFDASGAPSSNTVGARFAGQHDLTGDLDVLYALEAAYQKDVDDAPSVEESYTLFELGGALEPVEAKLGYEILGGDGTSSLQTPLATLHAFNGWADKFLAIPPAGLEDLYVSLSSKVSKGRATVVLHDFSSDTGSTDYGTEVDVQLTWPLGEHATLGAKYADYDADAFATDTRKFWLWLAWAV